MGDFPIVPPEKVRLRIGNLAKAVLVTGQAYQDPKDALNEFVSNAADEYIESGTRNGRIRIVLRRRGQHPVIAIHDDGRGLSPERLRDVARNLFESAKADDVRTLGEKAIGLLAFQQLGRYCDVVSLRAGSDETWVLRLERGTAVAHLDRERRRARTMPGTSIYLHDLDPDVLRMLTQRKVVDYLRLRRGPALARGDYSIEVVEGRDTELVTPVRPEGVRLALPPLRTLWGRIEFALYVAPPDGKQRAVAVVGRAGTTIIDDLAELDEFAAAPWSGGQVSGQIVFEALQQSAGRRAILRDREAFPVFLDAVRAITPTVVAAVEQVAREVDTATAERVADLVRQIFGRVLKELSDLDNPMRTLLAVDEDTPPPEGVLPGLGEVPPPPEPADWDAPPVDERQDLEPNFPEIPSDALPPPEPLEPGDPLPPPQAERRTGRRRSTNLPSLEVDPTPGESRSRFDDERGVVLYNDHHADFLLVKDDEPMLLDYLATLVAKEYVVYNNPVASGEVTAEEMVRMVVRVRRHLQRRR
jgi:hypothetical protein